MRARTEKFGNTSMTILTEIHGFANDAEDLRASIRQVQVHVDLATHKPLPIPAITREIFQSFDRRTQIVCTGDGVA